MKITNEQLTVIRENVMSVINDHTIELYETGNFFNAENVKDLNVRFRWDAQWRAMKNSNEYRDFIHSMLDNDDTLSDNHIDTALRRIVPAINRRY